MKVDMLAVKKVLLKVLLVVAMWGRKKVELKEIKKAASKVGMWDDQMAKKKDAVLVGLMESTWASHWAARLDQLSVELTDSLMELSTETMSVMRMDNK
jgi:hypothetical protein